MKHNINFVHIVAVLYSVFCIQGAFANTTTVVVDAPVEFNGQTLFVLHSRVGSVSPEERAKLVSARLQRLSKNRLFDPNSITVTEENSNAEITVGDTVLISLSPSDAKYENKSVSDLANSMAQTITNAIIEERRIKSPKEILIHSAYALLITLLFLVLFVLAKKFFQQVSERIKKWKGTRIRSLRIKTIELLTAERLVEVILWFVGAIRLTITLILMYFYFPLVFSLFPWTADLAPKLYGYILDPLKTVIGTLVDFIPNLFFIIVICFVTRYVLKFIYLFFSEIERGNIHFAGFYREWAVPTYKMVRILVFAFAVIVIFPYLPGSNSPAFQGVSVFLGLLFSFGSSSAIANIVSGVVLTYMRPFKLGDRVRIADTMGDVIEKTLLVTRIRTIKNVDITVPNSMVLGSHIVNYSSSAHTSGLILHTEVTIGYDVPWKKVHELLIAAAKKTNLILAEPSPFVLQTALNDFFVTYQINAHSHEPNKMAVIYSELHKNIQDAFNEAGVEIMSPHYTSLRDGNTVTIPLENLPADYAAPAFTVSHKTNPS